MGKKTGGYHIDIGQKTIQKAKALPVKAIDSEGCLPSSLRRGKGATYLTNN